VLRLLAHAVEHVHEPLGRRHVLGARAAARALAAPLVVLDRTAVAQDVERPGEIAEPLQVALRRHRPLRQQPLGHRGEPDAVSVGDDEADVGQHRQRDRQRARVDRELGEGQGPRA